MSYGLSLTTVPKDLYYVERKLVSDQAAEIGRLRAALFEIQTQQLHIASDTDMTRLMFREAAMDTRDAIIKILAPVT